MAPKHQGQARTPEARRPADRASRFIATEGASEFATSRADPPQAADFLLTIIGLAARRSALGRDAKADDHG